MQVIDAVVGRKWLGTDSCVSFCGQHGELVRPWGLMRANQKFCLGPDLALRKQETFCQVLMSTEPLVTVVYAIV